ncbi:MAG: GNA1162 family protein [Phocaeicola sp.]
MKKLLFLLVSVIVFTSCGTLPTRSVTYKTLYDETPASILALPPINRSTKVGAKELFYSSLTSSLTQKGYYVLSPLLAMDILKEESAYDAELFLNNSMKQVGTLFGVDAVLFTIIHDWSKTTIASQVKVKIEYILKSTKTDEVLFNRIGDVTLSLSVSTGNSWIDLIGGMVATALTNEIVVGRSCNFYTLSDLPEGKYSPYFQKDGDIEAGSKLFKTTITESY